jgi:5-hydroxyisourate hydrolase-like protein (transthyretin family)
VLRERAETRIRHVVDAASGAPVAGAEVRSADASPTSPYGQAVSGENGSFTLTTLGDPYLLCCAPGYQPEMFLASEEKLNLSPGRRTRLRIRDDEGHPRPGIELVLVHWTNGPVASGPVPVFATTGDDGGVDVYGSYPVTGYLLEADAVARLFTLARDRRADEEVRTQAPRVILGTVRISGFPAAHVPVYLLRADSPEMERRFAGADPVAYTDHGGRFQFARAFDGKYLLATRSREGLPTVIECEVAAAVTRVHLEMASAPTVRGRVVSTVGKPVGGVLVGLHCRSAARDGLRWFPMDSVHVRTDANGRFELPAVALDQAHTLSVQWDRGDALTRNVMPPDEVEIVFDRSR